MNLNGISAPNNKVESFVPTGKGKTYYVATNGSDTNPGTKEQPWKTISYATSAASAVGAGDTILVQSGTYTEQVNLRKSGNAESGHIVLKADGNVTLLDPTPTEGNWQDAPIKSSKQSYWVIDGFEIKNTSWAGISLQDASNFVVQNNRTFETGASGIIILPDSFFGGGEGEVTSKNIKVLNNTVERANNRWAGRGDSRGTQEAISIWGVDGFEVAGNVVNGGTREGIDAKTGSRNGSIHDNVVTGVASISGTPGGYNGGPAIYVDGNRSDTFNIDIYNNLVYGNTADGIIVGDEEVNQGIVRDIRVFNNVVYGNGKQGVNGGVGIGVGSNVSNVEITNNTVVGNVQSLVVDKSDFFGGATPTNITVRNNVFANDTYRGGLIDDVNGLVLDNNLFANSFAKPYEKGKDSKNLVETKNTQVASAGFVNAAANDYRLTPASVAVDAGSNAIPGYITTDKDGNQRRAGNSVDLGAFEFASTATPTPTPAPAPTPVPTPAPTPTPVGDSRDGADRLPTLDLEASRLVNPIQRTQTGTAGNNRLLGSGVNDFLDGLEGNDSLAGNSGNDLLSGGLGSDKLLGGQGDDIAFGGDGNDTFQGDRGKDSVSGGNGNDKLFGDTDADLILGDAGDDILAGGTGNDNLGGGEGNDKLNGDSGNDYLEGGVGLDVLSGGDNQDTLYGGADNDRLLGGKANDTLIGGSGNDWLNGEDGRDSLTGGTGQDTFVLAIGNDLILDFEDGIDRLSLAKGLSFKQLSVVQDGNSTLIQLTKGNKLLATLSGVDSGLISSSDFGAV